MISEILIPKLKQHFPDRGLRIGTDSGSNDLKPCAVFPAIHPDVGTISICDDGDELTVHAGNYTHTHFSNYDDELTEEQKAEKISDEVIEFLKDLFSDKIVLYRSYGIFGGWYPREENEKKESKGIFNNRRKEYVWSGPLSNSK